MLGLVAVQETVRLAPWPTRPSASADLGVPTRLGYGIDGRLSEMRVVECRSLADVFDGRRAPSDPFAVAAGQTISFDRFARTVAAVDSVVRQVGPGRWLLTATGTWGFAAGFFGLLRANCSVVIPPNGAAGTVERFYSEVDGVLTDGPSGLLPGPRTCCIPEPGERYPDISPLEDGVVEFWTSGSTGGAKCVGKRLSQLDAEVAMLQETFGRYVADGPVFGTVPHSHIYGCLFRLLWPLATGRPFVTEQCADPAQFQSSVISSPAAALVSSPTLLARLPELVDLDRFKPIASAVFSSGGPMGAADARAWRRWIPAGVIEVYGSTETGGIAWRIQSEEPSSTDWTPFRDVAIAFEPDGALRIESLRAGAEPVRVEDAGVPVAGGRFRLLGRLDRTVKLGEKRVSLPELELEIEAHPSVSKAAVVTLGGSRTTLGAAVVLAERAAVGDGRERHAMIRGLRRHLALRFESVAIPRHWVFVGELPYDGRGKLLAESVAALFALPDPPGSICQD
jgi:acyl-CoA synthetase (AMP-forming)/AMP-acid ligase II